MNIPNLKAITAEERQEDNLPKVNVEHMNQICGSLLTGTTFISKNVQFLKIYHLVSHSYNYILLNIKGIKMLYCIVLCPLNGTTNVRKLGCRMRKL